MRRPEDLSVTMGERVRGRPAETLVRSYPAIPASITTARRDLVAFAASGGASEGRLETIRLATSEALTNVVLHAYRESSAGGRASGAGCGPDGPAPGLDGPALPDGPAPGPDGPAPAGAALDPPSQIHVTAAIAADEIWVLISDDGHGFQPRLDSPGLGTGLALIAMQCDDLTIVSCASGGTELRMRFRLDDEKAKAGGDDGDGCARAPDGGWDDRQSRGSVSCAFSPASPVFSTMV